MQNEQSLISVPLQDGMPCFPVLYRFMESPLGGVSI